MPLKFSKTSHTYTNDGLVVPSVTQVISGVGLTNFGGISPDILQRAADFGTAVHRGCHLDDLGDLDELSLDPNLKPYLEAWRSFRGGMIFEAIEQPLFHSGYGFCGTPDRIAKYYSTAHGKGMPAIIDLKTGTTVYPSTAIQLAGYAILADIPTARRLAVQLLPTGKFKVTEYTDRKDREIFLAALAVYKWGRNHATISK